MPGAPSGLPGRPPLVNASKRDLVPNCAVRSKELLPVPNSKVRGPSIRRVGDPRSKKERPRWASLREESWMRGGKAARTVFYIMPAPGGICGISFSSFGFSAMMVSVVSISPATEAAFCSALRVTLAGSMTPALIRSSTCSV